jgi:peroxiredoxin
VPCREHLAQLRRRQASFDELNAAVLVVSFEPPRQAARMARALGLPFPVLSDPDRRAYAAFGLRRGARERVWSWETAGAYLKGMTRGTLPRRPRGDINQLGGDFVIAPDGRLAFAYRGDTPADRPSVDTLLAAVRDAVAARPIRPDRPTGAG